MCASGKKSAQKKQNKKENLEDASMKARQRQRLKFCRHFL